jgi:hypothetical protein
VGAVILKNSPEVGFVNGGKITFTAATSIISTGNTGVGAAAPVLTAPGYSLATGTAFTGFGIPLLHGDGAEAKATTSAVAPVASVGVEGKVATLIGATGGTIIGGDTTPTVDGTKDGRISSETITQPTEPAP